MLPYNLLGRGRGGVNRLSVKNSIWHNTNQCNGNAHYQVNKRIACFPAPISTDLFSTKNLAAAVKVCMHITDLWRDRYVHSKACSGLLHIALLRQVQYFVLVITFIQPAFNEGFEAVLYCMHTKWQYLSFSVCVCLVPAEVSEVSGCQAPQQYLMFAWPSRGFRCSQGGLQCQEGRAKPAGNIQEIRSPDTVRKWVLSTVAVILHLPPHHSLSSTCQL